MVDRLLASPRYGERMALEWLDLARYADTHGYHIDSHRDMWPWRDWVIDAFNANMPFDQFTIEQLAGDLLPERDAGAEDRHRVQPQPHDQLRGRRDPGGVPHEYVVDRVDTTATDLAGPDAGCARCHDHKYDPITQKEFYQFYAFFNNVPENGLDGKTGNAAPLLRIADAEEQKAEQQRLTGAIQDLTDALSDKRRAAQTGVGKDSVRTLGGRAGRENHVAL